MVQTVTPRGAAVPRAAARPVAPGGASGASGASGGSGGASRGSFGNARGAAAAATASSSGGGGGGAGNAANAAAAAAAAANNSSSMRNATAANARGFGAKRNSVVASVADAAQRQVPLLRDPLTGADATPLPLLSVKAPPMRSVGGDDSSSASMGRSKMSRVSKTSSRWQGMDVSSLDLLQRFSTQTGTTKSLLASAVANSDARSRFSAAQSTTLSYGSELWDDSRERGAAAQKRTLVVDVLPAGGVSRAPAADELVDIVLCETATLTLFDQPSVCVHNDDPRVGYIRERNAALVRLKALKVGNDSYVERGCGTANARGKAKVVQSEPMNVTDHDAQVDSWDISDRTAEAERRAREEEENLLAAQESAKEEDGKDNDGDDELDEVDDEEEDPDNADQSSFSLSNLLDRGTTMSSGSLVGASETQATDASDSTAGGASASVASSMRSEAAYQALLRSDAFAAAVQCAERVVSQNALHGTLLEFKGLLPEPSTDDYTLATSKLLWTHQCDAVAKDLAATCMALNPRDSSLLVVGYGAADLASVRDGLLLVWSIQNAKYPVRIIRTDFSVTSLACSSLYPNLVAVGTYAGVVAIYDICSSSERPIAQSDMSSGRHGDPVWEVQWVLRDGGSLERVVSVSTDGRVVMWELKKGLHPQELMKMKRVPNPARLGDHRSNAFIVRWAGAMCVSFSPSDANMYFVGMESGSIMKCSIAYTDQYIEHYVCHSASVHRIRFNPFDANVFLSVGADWTAAVWRQSSTTPVLVMTGEHVKGTMTDCCWSSAVSTVFATACANGTVSIYDLRRSQIDPIVRITCPKAVLRVQFYPGTLTLVVALANGVLEYHRLHVIEPAPASADGQLAILRSGLQLVRDA